MRFYFEAYFYNCSEVEAHWKIQRADGETEVYPVVNETYRYHVLLDIGLNYWGLCYSFSCSLLMIVNPTDLRYNGAKITGVQVGTSEFTEQHNNV